MSFSAVKRPSDEGCLRSLSEGSYQQDNKHSERCLEPFVTVLGVQCGFTEFTVGGQLASLVVSIVLLSALGS